MVDALIEDKRAVFMVTPSFLAVDALSVRVTFLHIGLIYLTLLNHQTIELKIRSSEIAEGTLQYTSIPNKLSGA